MTAAVQPLEMGHALIHRRHRNPAEDAWQQEAWQYYNSVGELRFVCQWLRNSASRVTLYAADIDPQTGAPSADPSANTLARQIVADIAGGPAGQSELMGRAATAMTVPGEMHVAILGDADGGEAWHIVGSRNVRRDDVTGNIIIVMDDGEERTLDPTTESIFRVHNPHPEHPQQADSPVRAALPILAEIRAMDALITAAARSRVAGNGILFMPKEVQAARAAAPGAGDAPGLPSSPAPAERPDPASTQLSRTLSNVMKQALHEPGSAEALTPIVLAVPGEHIDKFRHLTFDNDVTDQHRATREAAIRRLALSLDVPAEVLLGMGDSTHWNAGLVDEQGLRQHIAPMLTTICDALTMSVLRPLLESMGRDPSGVVVWFDMSPLAQKQDRGEDALRAFEAGAVSADVLRRELGFDPNDAPSGDQRAFAERLVTAAPSLFPYLAEVLGFEKPDDETVRRARQAEIGATVPLSQPKGAAPPPGHPEAPSGPQTADGGA